MKKFYFYAIIALMAIVSCQKNDRSAQDEPLVFSYAERKCASYEVLQQQMEEDPSLRNKMIDIEQMTNTFLQKAKTSGGRLTSLNIPVVVHVIYNSSEQNISDEQIASQISVLNEDFTNTNGDRNQTPSIFSGVQGSMNINFTLAQTNRVQTSKKSFGTDDGVKYSKRGGSDAVDPSKYLNIWVCNLGQNLLGYAQFPGGKAATDGVVILYSAFGSRAKYNNGTYISKYDLGRTATHEVGHWINLRHIWGDATCGNDYVDDTPLHNTANYGCPAAGHKSTCTGQPLEMYMNYMDYTDDACMYMFTSGQKLRADAIFVNGGPRASFAK